MQRCANAPTLMVVLAAFGYAVRNSLKSLTAFEQKLCVLLSITCYCCNHLDSVDVGLEIDLPVKFSLIVFLGRCRLD